MKAALALVALFLAVHALAEATPKFPPFKNLGSPPFLRGPAMEVTKDGVPTQGVGLFTNDTVAFLFEDADGKVGMAEATYTSWECGPEEGSYLALLDTSHGVQCQHGILDVDDGKLLWAMSTDKCPGKEDLKSEDMLLETDGLVNVCAKGDRRTD